MILLGLSLLALSGYGQDEENDYYNIPWSWSPEELNKIQAIEEKLKQEDGFWIYKKKTYEVKSDISAPLTGRSHLRRREAAGKRQCGGRDDQYSVNHFHACLVSSDFYRITATSVKAVLVPPPYSTLMMHR